MIAPAADSEFERTRLALIEVYEAGSIPRGVAIKRVDGAIAGAIARYEKREGKPVPVAVLIEVLTNCLEGTGKGEFTDPEWQTPANAMFRARGLWNEIVERRARIRERL